MVVEDLTAEELVTGLEKCTFDVLLPLMPRIMGIMEKVPPVLCLDNRSDRCIYQKECGGYEQGAHVVSGNNCRGGARGCPARCAQELLESLHVRIISKFTHT
jgi:hypothetical protein